MTSDDLAALWDLYRATGVRPEWALPVLYEESGLDPSRPNAAGAPYYGINQASAGALAARGIAPGEYLSWSAGDQIRRVVASMWASSMAAVGPVRSATRVMQLNFLPATIPTARALFQAITWRGSPYYRDNAQLDFLHKGAITVSDLAYAMTKAAQSRAVQSAIAGAYRLAPGETPSDPVYGHDFLDPLLGLTLVAAGAGSGLLVERLRR